MPGILPRPLTATASQKKRADARLVRLKKTASDGAGPWQGLTDNRVECSLCSFSWPLMVNETLSPESVDAPGSGPTKSDGEFTVPLCAIHHAENHATGDERRWWEQHKIDPLLVASALWHRSHALDLGPTLTAKLEVAPPQSDGGPKKE